MLKVCYRYAEVCSNRRLVSELVHNDRITLADRILCRLLSYRNLRLICEISDKIEIVIIDACARKFAAVASSPHVVSNS